MEQVVGGAASPLIGSEARRETQVDLRRLAVRRHPLHWRAIWPRALALWLATRLFDALLTLLFTTGSAQDRLGHWFFFDAQFYTAIAKGGYKPGESYLAPFFPLFPLLLRPFQGPSQLERLLADLAIGNLGTLAAFLLVGLLAMHESRDLRVAWGAMVALAVSPLAVFLGGVYSDGLFIAICAGTLLAARRASWGWAVVGVALAVVTRPFGMLLVPAALVEFAQQRHWLWRLRAREWAMPSIESIATVTFLLGLPMLTFCGYLLDLLVQYGDPLMFLHAEGASSPGVFRWGHALLWPWQTLGLAFHEVTILPIWSWAMAHLLVDLLPIVFCLVVALVTARRVPAAFTVLTVGVALICLVTPLIVMPDFPDPLASDGRYCYAAVPVLLTVAAAARDWPRWVGFALAGASFALQAALTIVLLRGGWLV